MNNAGNIYASGNLTAGTIKSNGTIESTGRIKAGEYLHLNGQATLNAKCTPNGLVGRDSSGRVLSCVSGKWQTASGDGLKGIFITITDQTSGYKCVIPNSDTGACACPGSMYDSRYGFYLEHLLRNMMNVVVVVVRTSTVIVISEGYMHVNKS